MQKTGSRIVSHTNEEYNETKMDDVFIGNDILRQNSELVDQICQSMRRVSVLLSQVFWRMSQMNRHKPQLKTRCTLLLFLLEFLVLSLFI